MEVFIQLISQVGFPIAVAAYLLYQNKQESESHEKEMLSMVQALNNNTLAITKLEERLEDYGKRD